LVLVKLDLSGLSPGAYIVGIRRVAESVETNGPSNLAGNTPVIYLNTGPALSGIGTLDNLPAGALVLHGGGTAASCGTALACFSEVVWTAPWMALATKNNRLVYLRRPRFSRFSVFRAKTASERRRELRALRSGAGPGAASRRIRLHHGRFSTR
jgi:hypothetical protein